MFKSERNSWRMSKTVTLMVAWTEELNGQVRFSSGRRIKSGEERRARAIWVETAPRAIRSRKGSRSNPALKAFLPGEDDGAHGRVVVPGGEAGGISRRIEMSMAFSLVGRARKI